MTKSALVMALFTGAALTVPLTRAEAQTQASAVSPAADTPAPGAPTTKPVERTTAEDVIITGHRATARAGGGLIINQTDAKSISTVSSAFIQTQSAIQNAYQYVQLTPGALVSESDPFGLSEQFSINVRGLGQDELGYVLEGMPLNDIGYYSAFPSQFIDSENIDEISLAQGSAELDSPVISAAGGLLRINMLDPSLRPGGLADVSYGSYNTNREFLRLDTGLIGDTGIRAFLSYSNTESDQWRGSGLVNRQHADFKIVKEWGNGNRVTLSGELHNGVTPTYLLPTLGEFQQYGDKLNFASSFTPGSGDYYKLNIGTFRIAYFSAPAKLVASDNLVVNITPYFQYGYGNSPYGTTLSETGNYQGADGPYNVYIPNYAANGGAVMANFQDLQYRAGVIGKVTYTMGFNSVIAGFWEDYSDESDIQSYTGADAQGVPYNIWADSGVGKIRLPSGQLLLGGADHVITETEEPFLADVAHLLDDKLTIEAGFKLAWVSRLGTNEVPGPQYASNIFAREPLPRAAARYQIDPHNQVFASINTNFRTPSEASMFTPYSGGYAYGSANTHLKTEYSTSEEVGYRYSGSFITGSATFFHYYFTNRQIATLVGGNLINESINAGSETTNGIDLEAGTHRWHGLSLYVSGEYLDATIDQNLLVGVDYLPTAGKTAIRSPKLQAGLGLSYDDGTFFGNFNVKYVDKQYSTEMNDESIPGTTVADLGLGARLPSDGLRARPEIKLNLINLGGKPYLSGVSSFTTNAQSQVGIHGTVIAGSSPTYYETAGLAAMFTISQAF